MVEGDLLAAVDGFETSVEDSLSTLDSTTDALAHETTISRHGSHGINVSTPVVSFGVNRTFAATSTRTTRQLSDINGDGLPDLLLKKSGESVVHVMFNEGSGFSAPSTWATTAWNSGLLPTDGLLLGVPDPILSVLQVTGADVLGLSTTASTSHSGSVSVAGIGGGGGRTRSFDSYNLALLDINGDGTPEHVLRVAHDDQEAIDESRISLLAARTC